jgi:hypothetical protein
MGWEDRVRKPLPWRAIAIALVVCLIGAGVAGYLIGNSSEVDLDAVRSAAAEQGREEGAAAGAEKGRAQGFREARRGTYGAAYSAAFKEAYVAEFRSRGLDPPERIRVQRPR